MRRAMLSTKRSRNSLGNNGTKLVWLPCKSGRSRRRKWRNNDCGGRVKNEKGIG